MKFFWLLIFPVSIFAQKPSQKNINAWQQQSKNVTIIRDQYGIPHIYGKTDADAVFGLLYAQCEDDFQRVEMNYIEKLGRLSEVNGQKDIYNDLLIRMVIDSSAAIRDYNNAPLWLKKLCIAFADGINYYLYKHPSVKPALLHHFEPWYPLLWTDGSIGAISTADVTVSELKNFYSGSNDAVIRQKSDNVVTGSNGFAFSPKITTSGHSILYINPHVTFYFRPEVHMSSEEGLNAYGAVTWGQFFIYQGFNEHCGWMHTSSNVDISDAYIENVHEKNGGLFYRYNNQDKKVVVKPIKIRYSDSGRMESKNINAFFTGHGPVMAKRNGEWISVRSDNRDIKGLIQSWQRTKARSFSEYKKIMGLLANTSNNTVYADAEGNIAYWHGNFIPRRSPAFDWSKPVDGTTSATDWQGLHTVNESVHLYNPPNGWLQNCNSTPFTVAGAYSPKRSNYPAYMAPDGENFRGLNAVRILNNQKDFTLEKVIEKGYDRFLTSFQIMIPALVDAYEKKSNDFAENDSMKAAIDVLKKWDFEAGENSIATTLAVLWGERLLRSISQVKTDSSEENDQVDRTKKFLKDASPEALLQPLIATIHELQKQYGLWQVPWGQINRFQRLTGNIESRFNDDLPSFPVGFVSSTWGMLPSYSSRVFPGTKKRYGVNGNSFICAVEFGPKIKARSLLAGGESGDPASPHFFDQGLMYSKGHFKEVLFYKEDVLKHVEKRYHP
jgi:acyl-homoserine-lactone acylase